MDNTLAGWLGAFLEWTVPSAGWPDVAECSTVSSSAMPCYEPPSGAEHLAPVTWFGTGRLLLICATVQVALFVLALVWDLAAFVAMKCSGKRKRRTDSDFVVTPTQIFFDCIDVGLSIASCVTFVMRSYRPPNAPLDYVLFVAYAVDWAVAGAVAVFYCAAFGRANSKTAYVLSSQPMLNIITITSSSVVQMLQEGWVPFTFLRSLTMSSALRRIFKMWDLPDLYEQLTLALADFLAMVFTFAGIIFVLENLGNPPGWYHEESVNLSLMQSVWYVMVTVSTVGYGDIYPVSFLGKLAGIVFIVVGVVFFSSNISHIGKLLQSQADGHGRYSVVSGKKHIILTGQVDALTVRDFAGEFFHVDHDTHRKCGMNMCLVTLEKVDIERYILSGGLPVSRLQALQGSLPTDVERLGLPKAKAVFFLGDTRHANSIEHDGEILLRAFDILKKKPDLEIYLTLLDPGSMNFSTGTIALCYSTFKTALLAKSALCPGIIPLIGNLVLSFDLDNVKYSSAQGKGKRLTREYLHGVQHEIYKVKIPRDYVGQRFGDVVLHNFTAYGILIIALGTENDDEPPHGTTKKGHASPGDSDLSSIAVHPGYAHEIGEDVAFVIAQHDPQSQIDESTNSFFTKLRDTVTVEHDDDTPEQSPHAPEGKYAGVYSTSESTSLNIIGQSMGSPFAIAGVDRHPEQSIVSGVEALFAARDLHTGAVGNSYFSDHDLDMHDPSHRASDQKSNQSVISRRSGRVAPLPAPSTVKAGTCDGVETSIGVFKHDITEDVRVRGEFSRLGSLPNARDDNARPANNPSLRPTPMLADAAGSARRPQDITRSGLSQPSIFDVAAILRPRIVRQIQTVKDLKPDMKHDVTRAHDVAKLDKHVVVCGMPEMLHEFLEPFKTASAGQQTAQVVPLLFLWDGPISDRQMQLIIGDWSQALKAHPESYLLQVPPLNPSSIVMANTGQAMCIVLLTDRRLASRASEPALMDSGVIFAQRFIRQFFPSAARKYVCELIENENIQYLDERFSESSSADGLGVISMEPVFSEGGVFSSSLCTSTLAQSFYNKDVLPILGALLSAHLTNFTGRSSVGEVQLVQAEIPHALQNKPYQELFEHFMRPTNKAAFDALPLGLYRRHDGMGESHWYTFTNPSPDTVVRSEDRVFCLQRITPWKEGHH